MSEAELHWLTSRMNEAKRAAARRGELRVPLPVGLVYHLSTTAACCRSFRVSVAASSLVSAGDGRRPRAA